MAIFWPLMVMQPMEAVTGNDLSVPGNAFRKQKYCVAVPGDIFRWLIDFGNEDVLNRVSSASLQRRYFPIANMH